MVCHLEDMASNNSNKNGLFKASVHLGEYYITRGETVYIELIVFDRRIIDNCRIIMLCNYRWLLKIDACNTTKIPSINTKKKTCQTYGETGIICVPKPDSNEADCASQSNFLLPQLLSVGLTPRWQQWKAKMTIYCWLMWLIITISLSLI